MTDTRILDGRVAIVTGAGQGLGRAHALALAEHGAQVVVNDVDPAATQRTAELIATTGGAAFACPADVADWDDAERLITTAVDHFGGLHALVNNAGIVRDRMLVSMTAEEWDAVMRVNAKGHFCPLRHAAAYWREQAKGGATPTARVINTSSGAGLFGSVGQGNYSAAKAAVAGLTLVAAQELARYGITVNAIVPAARTPMTETVFADAMRAPDGGFDAMDPANVSPLVVWLASEASGTVTGRMFEVEGGIVGIADGWQHGPRIDKGARWRPEELTEAVTELLQQAPPPRPVYGGQTHG